MKIFDKSWEEEFDMDWKTDPLKAVARFLYKLNVIVGASPIPNEAGDRDTLFGTNQYNVAYRIVISLGKDRHNPDPWIGVWRKTDDQTKPARMSTDAFALIIGGKPLSQYSFEDRINLIRQILSYVDDFVNNLTLHINGNHYKL